jgi:hypothetical protein
MEAPQAPRPWRLVQEGLTLGELPRLLWNLPDLAAQPRGDGAPVLVLPGFGTGDASTLLLRAYLGRLGHRVRGWGLGLNRGDVGALVPRVLGATDRLAQASGRRVRLIGWSLGGVLARETARERPDAVERVVTLGSPVVGGPKYTTVGAWYAQRGFDLDEIEAAVAERDRTPIRVPITAIYSRRDGIVAWQACIDRVSPQVEHVEVRTTHLGLGFSPEVYRIVARRLALPRGADARGA